MTTILFTGTTNRTGTRNVVNSMMTSTVLHVHLFPVYTTLFSISTHYMRGANSPDAQDMMTATRTSPSSSNSPQRNMATRRKKNHMATRDTITSTAPHRMAPFSVAMNECVHVQSNLDISKLMGLVFTSSNYPKCKLIFKKVPNAKLWFEKAIKMYFWFGLTP